MRRPVHALAAWARAARLWRAMLVLLAAAIGWLALTPAPPLNLGTGWDKLNHVLAFAALAFSVGLGFPASARLRAALLCGLLAYGGSIEILQQLVPGRASEWSDLFADSIGIAGGALLAAAALRAALKASRPAR